jgi:hypothetical protein
MPTRLRALLLTGLCILSLPGAGWLHPPAAPPRAAAAAPEPADAYLHFSTADNTAQTWTHLENPALNGYPTAMFLAINQLQVEGNAGDRDAHPLGLWWDGSHQRWTVFNDDGANMDPGLAFNVFLPPSDQVMVHSTADTNTVGSETFMDSPIFNGDPNAILLATHVLNPGAFATGGPYSHTVAVTYDTGRRRWAIVTADGAPLPTGGTNASFHVWRAGPGGVEAAFQQTSTNANRSADYTIIDNAAINGQPDALLLVTPYEAANASQPADTHPVGVWYDSPKGRWTIFNEDGATMASGLTWNAVAIPPLSGFWLQTATFDNEFPTSQVSLIDDPRLNNHPEARLYVSHNWNPPESPNEIYDNHPIGARYSPPLQRWYVCNLDGSYLPIGTTFNVYFTWPRASSFKVAASSTTTNPFGLIVNSPLLNGDFSAAPIVTNDLPTEALCGPTTYGNPVGVAPTVAGWQIFKDTGPDIPPGASFDVLAPPAASNFVQLTTPGNTMFNYTVIDNLLTNGDPWAMVFPTPRDEGYGLNDQSVGVFYTGSHWAIFNEDKNSAMATRFGYDVFVIKRRYEYLPLIRR